MSAVEQALIDMTEHDRDISEREKRKIDSDDHRRKLIPLNDLLLVPEAVLKQ